MDNVADKKAVENGTASTRCACARVLSITGNPIWCAGCQSFTHTAYEPRYREAREELMAERLREACDL